MKGMHLEADISDFEEAKTEVLAFLPPGSPYRDFVQGAQMTENGLTVKKGPFRILLSFPDVPAEPG